MKITFLEKNLSIDQFDELYAGNFVVLTGVNGSGKSHLLDAIEKKRVRIDDSDGHRVVKFNFENFRLENEVAYNAQQISAEQQDAWGFYKNQIKPNVASIKSMLGDAYPLVAAQCRLDNRPLWHARELSLEQVEQYKKSIKDLFSNPHIKGHRTSVGLHSLVEQLPCSIDDIEQEEFTSIYKPFSTKQDFLPIALGKVVWDYYIKYLRNQFNEFQNEKYGKTYPVLTEQEFIVAHGLKPWDTINSILKTFNSLEYRVNSPEGVDYFDNFIMRLVHTSKPGLEVEFSNLSSGERVLMALVASIYKSTSDNYFPDVLLLDELDASLHPSMIKNMLTVIRDIFLQRGVKVILVTHSPTTIALCPEESIYVMNRSGLNRIEKKSKNEALTILTEGIATLEESLLLFDEVTKNRVSIVTEGKNTLYIKKALSFAGIGSEVSVIEGVESITGKSQLKTLYDFFSRVPHTNKVLFVWDCDANYALEERNSTYPFFFTKNDANPFAKIGIENLFPEKLFEGFLKTITPSQGAVIIEFDESRKRDFERHVLNSSIEIDFSKFNLFIEKIRSLLNQ